MLLLLPGGTSTDNPDGGIYTHGYHFLSDAAENTFDDFFVAATHNYGPEVINQGLAYYLAFDKRVFDRGTLDQYVRKANAGTEPVKRFEKLVGMPLARFEREWRAYMITVR